ncbi:MAG: cyclic 2,3-diphosphoglycerate synthase [Candidatus Bathyarchaeia archaeon]
MAKVRVIIMGAAGRDFHNFNVYFRNNDDYEVVAFTATQIPGIEGRVYPPELAGKNYPNGIPIYPEEELARMIRDFDVDQVVFAYSDVSHEYVMHKASIALASGADFRLMGPKTTMLKAKVPVISVGAVRTGSGKSQTSRQVAKILKGKGLNVVVVRHPMPYGDLRRQICQRFASHEDLDRYECTIEEREEYEPHIENDGGNNDTPFYQPDLHIVVADPHRAGHEITYHPGEANLIMANVVIINKVDTADPKNVNLVKENIRKVNPNAIILEASSPITADKPELIKGKRVLVIEDGPTLTHGDMPYGAATILAKQLGAIELADPRPHAVGSIKKAFKKYPHLGAVLPALGYGEKQIEELNQTIMRTPCDVVVIGTPVDLRRVMKISKPTVRVKYELKVLGPPSIEQILEEFLGKVKKHEK